MIFFCCRSPEKTEKKRSSSLTRRSGKLQASAETDHVEEKPGG